MDKKSNIEKLSGGLPTTIAATLLAVFSGNPLSVMLPVLSSSLASTRHKKRAEQAISDISIELESQKEKVQNLTDAQYKIVNEAILAVFHTLEKDKLTFLRNVVRNSLQFDIIENQEAALISRLVRDLSAAEANFLIERQDTARFMLSENRPPDNEALHILPDSELGLVASGLVSLGLLVSAGPTWDDTGILRYAPIVKKLVTLLDKIDA